MKKSRLEYLLFSLLSFVVFGVKSQTGNTDAVVTIIGNPVGNTGNNDTNLGNTYDGNGSLNQQPINNPPAPAQQQFADNNNSIEPNFQNGFHMRFQIESPQSVERITSTGSSSYSSSSSASSGGAKMKKRTISMAERSFNFKKRFKNWMPHRKKRYRPTLCEKFR